MTIQDTVTRYFALVETGGSQDIPSILNLFVPTGNIGLTTAGPQFSGQDGITDLFTTLKNTFSFYAFDLTSPLIVGNNMIAAEATLTTGHVKKKWSPVTVPASPPLSVIHPNALPQTTLPVCAVFTMDAASTLIINLALYFDRWKLAQDKWDKAHPTHIDK